MIMGIVADDITGANDIGSMYAKHGWNVQVISLEDALSGLARELPDVLILDTNSRLDEPSIAYAKVRQATAVLKELGCQRYFKKTCSVLRGPVGAEFDAVLDFLGEETAVVVAGFPKNGRVTKDGVHYVHGRPLAESEFRYDPAHPMTESNLVNLLAGQTRRPVHSVNHVIIQQGDTEMIKQQFCRKGYSIADVLDQVSLVNIARAVQDMPVLGGSSALAEELALLAGKPPGLRPPQFFEELAGSPALIAAGSLMPQTTAQIQHIRRQGITCLELPVETLMKQADPRPFLQGLVDQGAKSMEKGQNLLLYTSRPSETFQDAVHSPQVHRQVSSAMAYIASELLQKVGFRKIIIAGGETSNAVCRALGIKGVQIWQEIEPGLPSCFSLNDPQLMLVLKSGSFGSPEFFTKALEHLARV